MAEKETQKSKKIKDLISGLSSKDEKTQVKSIKSLKIHGNETAIEPLVQLLSSSGSEDVKKEISDLLNTLKTTKVQASIIACLSNPKYKNCHQDLLISIWSTGLNYNQYMGEIATATVEGDLMEAIECITILENLEESLDEDQIMDALLIFKSYLVDTKTQNDSKDNIIKEIVMMLQDMNDTV